MRKLSTGSRLAVVGNCQAAPLAGCLRTANPRLEVTVIHMARQRSPESQQRALQRLESVHIILVQPGQGGGLLESERLRAKFSDVVLYPKLTFYGFHPDFFYLRDPDGRFVPSPCGPYHSKIVATGFMLGLSEERVGTLFNSFVFSRFGYFGKFGRWKEKFLSKAAEIGYDLRGDFESWLMNGAFMYTLNHPAIRVIASVASHVMSRAGIEQISPPAEAPDPLARAMRLPVYPDIAASIGIEPIHCFGALDRDRRPVELSLADFITASYRIYRGLAPAVFEVAELISARDILRSEICS